MTEHTHRPTYLNFMNSRRVYRCKHCQKPLKCSRQWLMYLCTLPALPALLLLYKTGLEYWYIAAVV